MMSLCCSAWGQQGSVGREELMVPPWLRCYKREGCQGMGYPKGCGLLDPVVLDETRLMLVA